MCLPGADADVPLVTGTRQLCCFFSDRCKVLGRKRINVWDILSILSCVSVCVFFFNQEFFSFI